MSPHLPPAAGALTRADQAGELGNQATFVFPSCSVSMHHVMVKHRAAPATKRMRHAVLGHHVMRAVQAVRVRKGCWAFQLAGMVRVGERSSYWRWRRHLRGQASVIICLGASQARRPAPLVGVYFGMGKGF